MSMDETALKIIRRYIDKSNESNLSYDLYIVWKCKTLQNWKYLIASSLIDGMYYELTFNGDKNEWYLDAYSKVENVIVREKGLNKDE